MSEPITLEPGIHAGISMERYHAIDACSNSQLKTMDERSPAHCREARENPKPSTPAQRLGTAIHAAVLEPHAFEGRYLVACDCAAPLKNGPRKGEPCGNPGIKLDGDGEWLCGQHGKKVEHAGGDILSAADYEKALRVRDAVHAHPDAAALLAMKGPAEATGIWHESAYDLPCKARFDKLGPAHIVDLKSTTDASPRGFPWEIKKWRYYLQAAFYMRGAMQLGHGPADFAFIALETEPPYGVATYELGADSLMAAKSEALRLMEDYAKHRKSNDWPGYPAERQVVSLPAVTLRNINENQIEAQTDALMTAIGTNSTPTQGA